MQMDLFQDYRPKPPPTVLRASSAKPDGRVAELALDAAVHVRPDPVAVYRLSVTHGYDACAERWGWLAGSAVSKLISHGRALTIGGPSTRSRRSLTGAQQSAIVDAVYELGGVRYAARVHAVPLSLVRTLLAERGLRDYPRASRQPAAVAAAAARVASALGRSAR